MYINKWTPRLELLRAASPKAAPGSTTGSTLSITWIPCAVCRRARTAPAGLTTSNLTRFQVNLAPGNILTTTFLYNLGYTSRSGLSILNPAEATTDPRQQMYMSTIRDQHYFNGALLDVGFADTRGLLRNPPQGDRSSEITPLGNRGNYFTGVDRHFYRQQVIANLFLPVLHYRGTHNLTVRHRRGARELSPDHLSGTITRCCATTIRVARVRYLRRQSVPAAQESGSSTLCAGPLVVRERASRWSSVSAPNGMKSCAIWRSRRAFRRPGRRAACRAKLSAGWGIYHDPSALPPSPASRTRRASPRSTCRTAPCSDRSRPRFTCNDARSARPPIRAASVDIERKLPFDFYGKTGYTWRLGTRGFVFDALTR